MAQRIGLIFVIALLALVAFTVYRNVFADDSAVRAMAETLARDTCSTCKVTRIEGKRGVLEESFDFTMQNGAGVAISCRRPYIAFGDVACTATKK
jgi:Tfp pilus assembly protein PilV